MISLEQAQALAAEAALEFRRKHGQVFAEGMSQLEYAKMVECIARTVYRESDGAFVGVEARDQVLMRIAGAALCALQVHGERLHTTHQLQRSLHPQQAGQKSLLLETQFMRNEASDAFKAAQESPDKPQNWLKLRAVMERMGVKF